DYDDAHVNHAIVVSLQGHGAQAIPEFQKLLQVNPKNLKAQANLATAYFDMKRYDEAAANYKLAIEINPKDPDMHANLGIALQKAGHEAEAQKAFADAERLHARKSSNSGASPK